MVFSFIFINFASNNQLLGMKTRIGMGFDVHRLVEGRDLWLGGIKIDHALGLLGHSDADVLIHAVCDAILGAANMRDIGYHFPDNSKEFENIDSKILLRKTVALVRENASPSSTSRPITTIV